MSSLNSDHHIHERFAVAQPKPRNLLDFNIHGSGKIFVNFAILYNVSELAWEQTFCRLVDRPLPVTEFPNRNS
jgi:hypothetical protein